MNDLSICKCGGYSITRTTLGFSIKGKCCLCNGTGFYDKSKHKKEFPSDIEEDFIVVDNFFNFTKKEIIMECDKCKEMMKITNWREYAMHTIYYWKCKHCGYEKSTIEEK